jgi:sulfur-carrier protein
MKAVYFAWVRERIGLNEEEIAPPAEVATIGDLVAWLTARGDNYAYAFDKPHVIRAAIDRAHVGREARIAGAREIAFFPPMTGG